MWLFVIIAIIASVAYAVHSNNNGFKRDIDNYRQQAEQYKENSERWKDRLLLYQDSVIILGLVIDSFESVKQQSKTIIKLIEKQRTDEVANIVNNPNAEYQLIFLTEWLRNRKLEGGVTVGGTTID